MGVPVYLVSFYVLLAISQSVQANLNLFMNKDEVKKLLGLHAELYYVRNGEINNYAMMFNLPIPHDIPELNFSWQNLRAGPPDMLYSISVNHSNPEALDQPRISIAKEGRVPTTPEAFTIVLPCTGKMSAEVEVHIQINVSIFSASNATILDFKRRKFCWEDVGGGSPVDVVHRDADAVAFESMPNDADLYDPTKNDDRDPDHYLRYPSNEPSIRDAIVTRSTNTNVFYIAMGCALALIVVIATLVIIYYIRSRKHNDRVSEISSHAYSTHPPPFGRMESHGHNPANMAGSYIRFSPVSDLKPPDLRTQISEISIERSRLTLADVIQEGTFGKIYHGVLLGEGADMEVENDVFVKTVTEQASESQVNLFITESCMMLGLSFPSIQTIRSMCMDNERQPLAVFPYASNGLLKKFLHKCKIPGEGQGTQSKLSTQELVHMGIQIIRGVQYLHKKKIIHKDLATRNCVVGQDLNVKITEKALSRDLFPNDYHCLGDNENRPVKWLAIESLIDKRFSPASDVWAFGVLLWELMTLGQQPYPDVDPFEMAQYLREGYRLSQPINCPDELFAVMACCWALCPDDRPKFTQLLQCLQDFYAHLGRYI